MNTAKTNLYLTYFFIVFLSLIFFNKISYTKDIPIIVITAGKSAQSYSTVGSSVTVIDQEEIEKSQDIFLTDFLNGRAGSLNIFQMGGTGTNTGVQIRGLPKRYSTVYIDGIKMSDPSTPDNSFYSQGIYLKNIERIEILKGNQSSLYGSNAIGGTLNIFTKNKGYNKESNISAIAAKDNTKNIYYSFGDSDETKDYFISFNRYETDGISAMIDNDEKDGYENETLIVKYNYKFSENTNIENSFTYKDTWLQYDEVTSGRSDLLNSTDNSEGHVSLKLINEKENYKNSLILTKSIMDSNPVTYNGIETNYVGYRDTINYLGEYNFNLDNRLVYGLDNEFVAASMPTDPCKSKSSGCKRIHSDEAIYSQYIDYQFRPFQNTYATLGTRFDKHTTAGNQDTYRGTVAYRISNFTKLKGSYGTGINYPALYDGHNYGWSNANPKENIVAEKSRSFDFGFETFLTNLNLNLDLSYFDIEIEDPLSSWNSKQENSKGTNKSKGFEFGVVWSGLENLELGFNYTGTLSYSGTDCDKPNKDQFGYNSCLDGNNGPLDSAMVRVPMHAINSNINYNFNQKINSSMSIRFNSEVRDYGGSDYGFKDQILDDYVVVDLGTRYKIFKGLDIDFKLINLFDKDYQQALNYQGHPRQFSVGLSKSF